MSTLLLDALFSRPFEPAACESVAEWWPRHREVCAQWTAPIARAIIGGFDADRVAWAFGAGHQAALRALDPSLADDAIACLCVTEAGGNTPRSIAATLSASDNGYSLNGRKKWTTLGPEGAHLLIVARLADGAHGERARLKVARVNAQAPGVRIATMPATGFVPELPHAEVHLNAVKVEAKDLLPGDGYALVVKPFRTIEDIHINAAILAYLVREARRFAWPGQWIAQTVAQIVGFAELARLDATHSATHIALEGALASTRRLTTGADALWETRTDSGAARRWKRDSALFGVAGGARSARFARACKSLGIASDPTHVRGASKAP